MIGAGKEEEEEISTGLELVVTIGALVVVVVVCCVVVLVVGDGSFVVVNLDVVSIIEHVNKSQKSSQ